MSSSTTSNNNEILKQRTYHPPSRSSKLDLIPSKKIQSLSWELELLCSSKKRAPKLELMHFEKLKELYIKVEHPANMYVANGAGVVLAEKVNLISQRNFLHSNQEDNISWLNQDLSQFLRIYFEDEYKDAGQIFQWVKPLLRIVPMYGFSTASSDVCSSSVENSLMSQEAKVVNIAFIDTSRLVRLL
ncbi:hypothetical protein Tco_0002069 [Tanacetum coccineum]